MVKGSPIFALVSAWGIGFLRGDVLSVAELAERGSCRDCGEGKRTELKRGLTAAAVVLCYREGGNAVRDIWQQQAGSSVFWNDEHIPQSEYLQSLSRAARQESGGVLEAAQDRKGGVWLFVWRMSGRVLGDGGQRNGRKLVNWARPASVGTGVGIGSVVEFTCERRTDALRMGAPYHPQATGDKARRFRPTHPSSQPACPDVDLPVSGLSSRRACCCSSSQPCCPAARAANARPSAARKQEA